MPLTLEQKILVIDHLCPGSGRIIRDGEIHWPDGDPPITEQEIEEAYPNISLNSAKFSKRREIDRVREEKIHSGMPYEIDGEEEVVQTRVQDKFNLLGIAGRATLLKYQGEEGHVITFRTLANNEYLLTPDEAIEMCMAAFEHMEEIYKTSWELKEQVEAAETVEDVEQVIWE